MTSPFIELKTGRRQQSPKGIKKTEKIKRNEQKRLNELSTHVEGKKNQGKKEKNKN